METRKIDLSIDTARTMFNSGDESLKAIALKAYPELSLNELERKFQEDDLQSIREFSEDVYLLVLLIAEFNRGWSPNWRDKDEQKWFIYLNMNGGSPTFNFALFNFSYAYVPTRLCFESEEGAKEFYNLHSNLINKIYSNGQAI